MKCPKCQSKQIIVRNNNFVCAQCKNILGPADRHLIYAKGPTATYVQSSHPQEGFIEDKKTTDLFIRFKSIIINFSILVSLISGYFFFTNLGNYIDLKPFCKIRIEENSEGNKDTIFAALKKLKSNDLSTYQEICKYVDTIGEQQCPASDSGENDTSVDYFQDCYIKGSKTIYLYPRNDTGDNVTTSRSQEIEDLTKLSKNFWQKN